MLNKSPIFEDYGKAVKRLEEVLKVKKTDISRDSAIKRFELCFDLAWKSIKVYARHKGIECYSPRDCFKSAFQLKLINHDRKWLKMIDDRSLIVHMYKEKYADEVYSRLSGYLGLFEKLYETLKTTS